MRITLFALGVLIVAAAIFGVHRFGRNGEAGSRPMAAVRAYAEEGHPSSRVARSEGPAGDDSPASTSLAPAGGSVPGKSTRSAAPRATPPTGKVGWKEVPDLVPKSNWENRGNRGTAAEALETLLRASSNGDTAAIAKDLYVPDNIKEYLIRIAPDTMHAQYSTGAELAAAVLAGDLGGITEIQSIQVAPTSASALNVMLKYRNEDGSIGSKFIWLENNNGEWQTQVMWNTIGLVPVPDARPK